MEPLNQDVRALNNEELHDYMRDILHSYVGDIEHDEYCVLEEAAQRLLDMG